MDKQKAIEDFVVKSDYSKPKKALLQLTISILVSHSQSLLLTSYTTYFVAMLW